MKGDNEQLGFSGDDQPRLILLTEDEYENWDAERVMEEDGIMLVEDLARILLTDEGYLLGLLQQSGAPLICWWQRNFVDLERFRAWYHPDRNDDLGRRLVS